MLNVEHVVRVRVHFSTYRCSHEDIIKLKLFIRRMSENIVSHTVTKQRLARKGVNTFLERLEGVASSWGSYAIRPVIGNSPCTGPEDRH